MASFASAIADTPPQITKTNILNGKGFLLHNFLSAEESKALVAECEATGTRYCLRKVIYDTPLGDAIWKRLAPYIPATVKDRAVVGLNPGFRICKYLKGHKFGPHVDFSVSVGKHQSIYTVMIYLNDSQGFVGGTTDFFDRTGKKVVESVAPQAGLAIVFLQDDQSLLHEGTEVQGGEKYMIRTDILFTAPPDQVSDEDVYNL